MSEIVALPFNFLKALSNFSDKFSEIDPQWISFPDLHKKICELENFAGDPNKSNEKILEAIQMHWIEEYD